MAITYNDPEQIDRFTWRFSWSSDLGGTPTFYVYLNGNLVDTTTLDEYFVTTMPDENVLLEVFDTATHVATVVWPGRLTIYWEPSDVADYYKVEEYVASVWTERFRVADRGEPQYRWKTRFLEDVTVHSFRVRGLRYIPQNGTYDDLEGTVATLTCLMVRYPDEPDVEYSYDSGSRKVSVA